MGHRGFVKERSQSKKVEKITDRGEKQRNEERTEGVECKKAKQGQIHDYIRTPNPDARNYFEEMAPINGVKELTEEQMAEVQAQRDAFRDQVSKRMGEMLLRGVTMLDAYCQTCNGILMEDRNGIRTCIGCELFREQQAAKAEQNGNALGARIIAEIPLDSDLNETDVDHTAEESRPQMNGHANTNQTIGSSNAVPSTGTVRVVDIERGRWATEDYRLPRERREKREADTQREEKSVKRSHPASFSVGMSAARNAVDSKLQWAAEELEFCEDVEKIRCYLQLIKECADTLRSLQQ